MEEFKTDIDQSRFLPKSFTKLSPILLCKWCNCDADFVITHLKVTNSTEITDSKIEYDQNKHLKMLILSTKNWSSYKDYGKIT
jgi:hypothetical protein